MVHENYNLQENAKGGGDIALLKLMAPVNVSKLVGLVSLPPKEFKHLSDMRCVVTGWESLPKPKCLQEIEVPLVGQQKCKKIYKKLLRPKNIKEDMICARASGKDSCQGDSGGPLVCNWNGTWVQAGSTGNELVIKFTVTPTESHHKSKFTKTEPSVRQHGALSNRTEQVATI
ncbi:PREDICTED: mastin-like [Elephantulus edwardii]|uniref:mastin-like n=1 Tax=Elephantulus edwardii TaxID=28737 RepID=UPI0003F093C7|nr:PREDICTED: mastin-like [Elephantulus edwardii]